MRTAALHLLPLLLPALAAQESVVLLANDSPLPREELVLVSVPFAPGACTDPSGLQVEGRPTAWRPLLRWPDGSLRVAQAQFPVKPGGWLGPGEILNLPIRPGKALAGPFAPHPWTAAAPADLAVEAIWDGGQARFPLEGPGETVAESPLCRISRFRGSLDAGRGLRIQLAVYVTAQSAAPILAIDLAATAPAGCRPRHLDLVSAVHPILVQAARRGRTGAPFLDEQGRHRAPLLRDLPFAAGQGRRWRLLLLVDDPDGNVLARGLARRTWQAGSELPLRALCDAPSWLRSGTLTLYGGPACPPPDWERRVRAGLGRWHLADHFGPFGTYGLPGPPGPASAPWVWAVQTSRGRLLDQLEGFAWQQACRPNHRGAPFPEPQTAHGWEAFDRTGAGLAHLFACWLATGDPWCQDELARLAGCALEESAGPMLDDGRLAEGLLRLWLATGDERLLERLRRRIRELWLPRLQAARPEQGTGKADLLWGLLAAWRQAALPEAAEAIAALIHTLPEQAPPLPLAGALRLAAGEAGLPEELRRRAEALAARTAQPPDAGWNPWTFLLSEWSGSEREPAPRSLRHP